MAAIASKLYWQNILYMSIGCSYVFIHRSSAAYWCRVITVITILKHCTVTVFKYRSLRIRLLKCSEK